MRKTEDGSIARHCAAWAVVEHPKFAEQVASFHEREHALAAVEWFIADSNSNSTAEHYE